jgi:hypothetical protein
MAKNKKGPTPRRQHREDGELERRYLALYAELGERNRELAEARAELQRMAGASRADVAALADGAMQLAA